VEIFTKLKKKNLKILLYTGNTDAVVSYIETVEYIRQIGWDVIQPRYPFLNDQESLMGWWIEYEGLTLAIINGAGHMVPSDKPHAAFEMFTEFINRI
jgi:carboxypeptidase C (cathepsin A)